MTLLRGVSSAPAKEPDRPVGNTSFAGWPTAVGWSVDSDTGERSNKSLYSFQ